MQNRAPVEAIAAMRSLTQLRPVAVAPEPPLKGIGKPVVLTVPIPPVKLLVGRGAIGICD